MTGSRRAMVLGGVLLAGLVSATLALQKTASAESLCNELARWAEPYSGTSITLDELAQFDRPHRLAIFNAVSPEVRAALWQEQLRRYAQRLDLTDSQRTLIKEGIALATPALYSRDASAVARFQAFESRVDGTFSGPRNPALYDLGSTATGSENATLSTTALARRPDVARGANCQCSTDDSGAPCGAGVNCVGGGCTTRIGCGIMGTLWCNGMCQ